MASPRYWAVVWDGKKISGLFSLDSPVIGTEKLGELRRRSKIFSSYSLQLKRMPQVFGLVDIYTPIFFIKEENGVYFYLPAERRYNPWEMVYFPVKGSAWMKLPSEDSDILKSLLEVKKFHGSSMEFRHLPEGISAVK